MRPIVALATSSAFPALTPDDRLLALALDRRGIAVSTRVWDRPRAWHRPVDLVVVRSCWDYHRNLPRFVRWLSRVSAGGVLNPPHLIEWNARKRYLLQLRDAGVTTGVPTILFRAGHPSGRAQVQRALAAGWFDWSDIVAKPEVSGNAWETHRLRPLHDRADLRRLEDLVLRRSTLVQPFLPDIAEKGEQSLIYFGGRFSHAVAKAPAPGDFRVQEEHGGVTVPAVPHPELAAYADRVVATISRLRQLPVEDIGYARVDVVNALPPRLMEVELIEPSLFLAADPAAPDRFADQIERHLGRGAGAVR